MSYIVSSGDLESGIILENNSMIVLDGGIATDTTVNSAGSMYISCGGIADSTTLYFSGRMDVSSGGMVDNTTVNSWGGVVVSGGGTATNTTVNLSGRMNVASGGTATNTTVNSGGHFSVASGGTAIGVIANRGAQFGLDVASDTFVQGAGFEIKNASISGIIGAGKIGICSGAMANNLTLSSGNIIIFSGGTAYNTTILAAGRVQVSSGGTANGTTIKSTISLRVSSGGEVNNTFVYSGGRLELASGGFANNTTVMDCGYINVTSGASLNIISINSDCQLSITDGIIANSATVNNGGRLTVGSGGAAKNIIENGGYVDFVDGADVSFVPNTFSGYVLSGISMTVHSGTTASSITMTLCNLDVSSGGVANNTVMIGGKLTVTSGGFISNTSTDYYVATGAFNCILTVSGGSADHTIIKGNWGPNYSFTGGIFDLSDGIANNTFVETGAIFNISSGGVASNTVIDGYRQFAYFMNASGTVNVFADGSADTVTVNPGGALNISGGKVTNIIENGGYVNVENFEEVTFASNTFSGVIDTLATVHSGTTAVDITLITASAISGEGIGPAACGSLELHSGGKLTGKVTLGGRVSACEGAIVDFNLTRVTPGTEALFYGLSRIEGTPTYTITVNEDQTEGIYTLSERIPISGFNPTITVVNSTGTELGTLTLGETIAISGVDYTLSLIDKSLSLTVGNTVTSSTFITDDRVVSNGEIIHSGEVFHDTVILAGNVSVSSGGVMDGVSIVSGSLVIHSGGTAHNIEENGGGVAIQDGAEVSFAPNVIRNKAVHGSMTLHSGTTAINTKIVDYGGIIIYDGGIASGVEKGYPYDDGYRVVVSSGGTVISAILSERDELCISSGGVAYHTILAAYPRSEAGGGGRFFIASGGTANGTVVYSGGSFNVGSGATANNTTVYSRGSVTISSDGIALDIVENGGYVNVADGANVSFASNTINGLILSGGNATVHSGTTANSTIIKSGGLYVFSGGLAGNATIYSGGGLYVSSSGIASNTRIDVRGRLVVSSGGMLTGRMVFDNNANVSARPGGIVDFDLTQAEAGAEEALVNDLSIIHGTPIYTLTVDADSWKPGSYAYALADGAKNFASTISVVNTAGDELGTLTVGETVKIGYDDYKLNLNEGALTVTVEVPDLTPANLVGTADGVTWDATGADHYALEYSTDDFAHVLEVVTPGTAVDTLNLPGGTYQWRVKADANSDWGFGEEIVSENGPGAAKVLQSDGDGNYDLFFANPCGTWETGYFAQHVGSVEEDWGGTQEYAAISGKNKLADFFVGSDDLSILQLTDDANGDAIFVDDIYTELPGTLEEQQARIARIDEIRAGAGDDIVDMTSQRFEYIGGGIILRGGDGNDVLWANKGDNWLFGDLGNDRLVGASGDDRIVGGAGDDRMHGGGGDDVFTFCENWGKDTVEQLAGGKVTLWFASGDVSNWNEAELTYTDGENSVTVKGVTADQIELKFGDDGTEMFAWLAGLDAFKAYSSRKIFEEPATGILAGPQ